MDRPEGFGKKGDCLSFDTEDSHLDVFLWTRKKQLRRVFAEFHLFKRVEEATLVLDNWKQGEKKL